MNLLERLLRGERRVARLPDLGARVAGGFLPAFDAKLAGDRIAFVLVDESTSHRFEGKVQGTLMMEGTVRSGPGRNQTAGSWRATRVVRGGDEG